MDQPFGYLHTVDPRLQAFGDYAALITDTRTFFKRLMAKIERETYGVDAGMIIYKDFSQFTGNKNVFEKDETYSYQKEWRLHLKRKEEGPYELKIDH